MKPALRRTMVMLAVVFALWLLWRTSGPTGADSVRGPVVTPEAPERQSTQRDGIRQMTMSEVLEMAIAARATMAETLDDYTAKFIKQERDANGVLGEPTEIQMKVQTRLRGDSDDAPMRVYLNFQSPAAVKGREVIWGEDLYGGKMAVHEVGMLLGLKTIWLDPNGMLAMQGQRYPIGEIGMAKLVEKLIERGEQDRNNPDIEVTLTEGHMIGETPTQLIQVVRKKPSGDEHDFSLAEIAVDPQRQLILGYRSFGWPAKPGEEAPLLESYRYEGVQTNVGLTDADFQTDHPDYNFPAF